MNKELKRKVELLSPAGSFEALKYAVNNGADAVYLAGKMFGARAFANNFDNEELKNAIDFSHAYGVKVYVTVNTIIFETEIKDALKFLDFLYISGVDAVIVQDLGLASIIKNRYPNLELHASTQMNIQTLEEARVLKKLGFKRIVLGREVNIQEIKRIKENLDIEIEVFVHGALCISYSGNCLMSSFLGSRSGNRGKCAQPCRLEYSYDGNKKYFLSTKDLCLANDLYEIYPYVDSLKIEGRMKNPSYVGVVTNLYKTQLNNIECKKNYSIKEKFQDLKITFNREFTRGFILNDKNSNITNCKSQNHLGVLVGEVTSFNNNTANIKLNNNVSIQINDCLRIVSKNYEDAIIVNDMYVNHKLTKKAFPGQIVNLKVHKRLYTNDKVYITKSEIIDSKYNIERRVSVDAICYMNDNVLYFKVTDGINTITKSIEVEKSPNNMKSRIQEQLLKINDTIFKYNVLNVNDIYGFIKVKDINELRRSAFKELYDIRTFISNRIINEKDINNKTIYSLERAKKYNILVSNKKQLDAVIKSNIEYDYIYIRDFKLYNEVKDQIKTRFYLPRVSKRFEKNAVTSNLYNLENGFTSPYLNVGNSYSIKKLNELGAEKIGLSLELSNANIKKMLEEFRKKYHYNPNVEVMIYGHFDAMIMKHCFINKEKNYPNKGCKECLKGIKLIDRMGKEYPLMKDENCNLTILYYKPLNLFDEVHELYEMGVNNFLINFTIETEEQVSDILREMQSKSLFKGHYYNDNL